MPRKSKSVPSFIACSACFADRGLRLDAEQIGLNIKGPCSNCSVTDGKKLDREALEELAHRFFVWGSLVRSKYGAAPLIQFNKHQQTSIDVPPSLESDIKLLARLLGIGFFYYGPRLWMVGEVEPLKALQKAATRKGIADRILREYPQMSVGPEHSFYRVRKSPNPPADPLQFDSPPDAFLGKGRLDSPNLPVLYASPDLELCIHECRVSAEDDLFVATLVPTNSLRLLDLSVLLTEKNVTEFESLDMAVHMLFLAGKHSYKITRAIADAAQNAGFDGVIYPSYFSLLQLGIMPFQTVFGISNRRIPIYQEHEQAKAIQNLAIFGRPIKAGKIAVQCIDRLVINQVSYRFHFGPVPI